MPLLYIAAVVTLVAVFGPPLLASAGYAWWRYRRARLDRPFGPGPLTGAGDIDVIITLVHGTWAWNAAWTHQDSLLRQTLTEHFPDRTVSFHVVDWSGGNTMRARDEAARQLAADLHALHDTYPTAEHFIVAHSHGGNVVMYALRDDPALRAMVSGVVFMATPFLHGRMRNLSPFDARTVRKVSAALSAAVLTGAAAAGAAGSGHAYAWWLPVATLIAGPFIGWKLAASGERRAETYAQRLALPSGVLPPVLVLRALADEASAALSMAFVGSLISALLWGKIARLAARLDHWASREGPWRQFADKHAGTFALLGFLELIPVCGIAWLLGVNVEGDWDDTPLTFRVFAFPGALSLAFGLYWGRVALLNDVTWRGLTWLVFLVVGVLLLPYAALVSFLSAVSVSPSLVWAGIYLDVVADTLPVGLHSASLYEYSDGAAMAHSRVYADARALRDVAAWMRAQLEQAPGTAGSPVRLEGAARI